MTETLTRHTKDPGWSLICISCLYPKSVAHRKAQRPGNETENQNYSFLLSPWKQQQSDGQHGTGLGTCSDQGWDTSGQDYTERAPWGNKGGSTPPEVPAMSE